MPERGKAPRRLGGGSGGGNRGDGGGPSRLHFSTSAAAAQEPVAYRVRKPGRGGGWPIVAKLTYFEGGQGPILGTVWRNQSGTSTALSLPRQVLLDAQRRGAVQFYLRDDNRHLMWRYPLIEFLRGRLQSDGEHYILISWMESVPWRAWAYAEAEMCFGEPTVKDVPEPVAEQLSLFGG